MTKYSNKYIILSLILFTSCFLESKYEQRMKQAEKRREQAHQIYNEGMSLLNQKKYPEAKEKFNKAIETSSGYVDPYEGLLVMAKKEGNKEATAFFQSYFLLPIRAVAFPGV